MRVMASQSPPMQLIVQPFAQKKRHHSSTLLAICEGNPTVTGGFTSQMVSKEENVIAKQLSNQMKTHFMRTIFAGPDVDINIFSQEFHTILFQYR